MVTTDQFEIHNYIVKFLLGKEAYGATTTEIT